MAHKYGMAGLWHKLMSHFEGNWPKDFDAFIFREQEIRRIVNDGTFSPSTTSNHLDLIPDPGLPNAVDALEMATKIDATRLLPCIYYDICRSTWRYSDSLAYSSVSLQGKERKTVTLIPRTQFRQIDARRLHSGDVIQCARIKNLFLDMALEFGSRSHRSQSAFANCMRRSSFNQPDHDDDGTSSVASSWDDDNGRDPCMVILDRVWAERIAPMILSPAGNLDPMRTMRELSRDSVISVGLGHTYGLCQVCDDDVQHTLRNTQERWWDALVDQFISHASQVESLPSL